MTRSISTPPTLDEHEKDKSIWPIETVQAKDLKPGDLVYYKGMACIINNVGTVGNNSTDKPMVVYTYRSAETWFPASADSLVDRIKKEELSLSGKMRFEVCDK